MQKVRPGKYMHFKGKLYEVLGTARHSENPDEEFVVYRALYSSRGYGRNALWVRPKGMFMQKVSVGGKMVPRFRFLKGQPKHSGTL